MSYIQLFPNFFHSFDKTILQFYLPLTGLCYHITLFWTHSKEAKKCHSKSCRSRRIFVCVWLQTFIVSVWLASTYVRLLENAIMRFVHTLACVRFFGFCFWWCCSKTMPCVLCNGCILSNRSKIDANVFCFFLLENYFRCFRIHRID